MSQHFHDEDHMMVGFEYECSLDANWLYNKTNVFYNKNKATNPVTGI